ncbi:MAG: hypothetical protein ACM3SS_20500 [Rhodospirillaceae bacterium]
MRGIAILLGGLLACGAAMAADSTSTSERTTVQKEPGKTTVQRNTKRSTQGELNANDPSSPTRATGTERAEQRQEMHTERKTSKSSAAKDRTTTRSETEKSATSSGGTSGMSGSGKSGTASTRSKTTESTTTTK